LILIGAVWFYFYKKVNALSRILKLRLELNPMTANRGQQVIFSILSDPEKQIKADTINGELICKRFDSCRGNWTDWTDLPIICHGQILAQIIFSFGKDLILVPGSENRYEGYIPIPDDAPPTEVTKLFQVKWMVMVRVHSRDYKTASVSKELKVTAFHPQMIEAKRGEQEQNVEFTPMKRKAIQRQNIQLVFSDSVDKHPGKKLSSQGSVSSFNYLELENEPGQSQKNNQ